MQRTTLQELEWIHDCVIYNIVYGSEPNGRSIKLSMRCPADLGYAPWEGENLVLVAIDVAMSQHVMWGVTGPETIDAIRPGISASARERAMDASRRGALFPSLEFTVSFHSGSSLEVVCEHVEVDVRRAAPLRL
jgi:hypothetical protein